MIKIYILFGVSMSNLEKDYKKLVLLLNKKGLTEDALREKSLLLKKVIDRINTLKELPPFLTQEKLIDLVRNQTSASLYLLRCPLIRERLTEGDHSIEAQQRWKQLYYDIIGPNSKYDTDQQMAIREVQSDYLSDTSVTEKRTKLRENLKKLADFMKEYKGEDKFAMDKALIQVDMIMGKLKRAHDERLSDYYNRTKEVIDEMANLDLLKDTNIFSSKPYSKLQFLNLLKEWKKSATDLHHECENSLKGGFKSTNEKRFYRAVTTAAPRVSRIKQTMTGDDQEITPENKNTPKLK
ncbi:Uncharacterised protein [Legionella wadsworthii]|uniref:Uncharacterized protein n=2 Tax=Legionella wadsworthii TaxID=28088 RepID=A0A378LSN0_9GAMM|nr:Uncharacterised protein [Legionella wadsworthii]